METGRQSSDALKQMIDGILPNVTELLWNLLAAALIAAVGIKLIGILRKWSRRTFERMKFDDGAGRFLSSCIGVALYGVLFFIIAGTLGVNSASIVALLGSAGIAISLAVQGSLSNFAGGVLLLLTKPFVVGDYIMNQDGEGTVYNIGIIYTTLITTDNRKIVLPNGSLANSPLTNLTSQDKRRVVINLCIGYEEDLKQVKALLLNVFQKYPEIIKTEPIDVRVDSLGENGVNLLVRGYAKTEVYWDAQWDLTEQVKLALDAAGVRIAPQKVDLRMESAEKLLNKS